MSIEPTPFVSMDVVGVRIEMPSNQPIVLLKEVDGEIFIPIWVGAAEATAIAFAQQGINPQRPLSHDLMHDIVHTLDATLLAVQITHLRDGVFFATLQLRTSEDAALAISARPSDAIALALRSKSNILASRELLDQVGIAIPERLIQEMDEMGQPIEKSSADLEAFRDFLDQINPEDFAG
ncbi:MAG: bifunctional nuclease family protein [Actinomycetota bacterium]|nr:bifunctional nuclease family protein [Actinomycetota bacterium]